MNSVFTISTGQGNKTLFLHGIGSSATAWVEQFVRLKDHFKCVAPDLPGYGGSQAPRRLNSMHDIAEPIVQILPENSQFNIVGVSFGALLGLYIAKTWPDRVLKIVLSDATLGRANMEPLARKSWLNMRQNLSKQLISKSRERAREIAMPTAKQSVIEDIAFHMRRAKSDAYLNIANIIANTDALPWLSAITIPCLVLCGENDQVTGAETSALLHDKLPNSQFRTIGKSGHAPHLEQPELFADLIVSFLNKT